MRTIDGSVDSPVPGDLIDAGDTSTAPTDIVISAHLLEVQPVTSLVRPDFYEVDTLDVIDPAKGLILVVRVAGTATTVTVEVPGAHPYTGVAKDDLVLVGLTNTDRVFHMPDLLFEPISEVASVTYSQTTGVSAALLKVD